MDEVFDVMIPRRFDFDAFGAPATLQFEANDASDADTTHRWTISVTDDDVVLHPMRNYRTPTRPNSR